MAVPFLQDAFPRIARRAGVERGEHGKLSPHSIRHTAATWMLRRGVPIEVVAKTLGHANTTMVYKTYGHILPNDLPPALAAIEATARGDFQKPANPGVVTGIKA